MQKVASSNSLSSPSRGTKWFGMDIYMTHIQGSKLLDGLMRFVVCSPTLTYQLTQLYSETSERDVLYFHKDCVAGFFKSQLPLALDMKLLTSSEALQYRIMCLSVSQIGASYYLHS